MGSSLSDTVWLSDKRLNLLLLLMEGPRNIDQIKTSLNVTSRGMMPQIKKLKEKYLIVEEGDQYCLSTIGELIVEKMLPLLNTIEMVNNDNAYLEEHDLSELPPKLFRRLYELGNYLLIEPDLNHTFEIPREFTENLLKSKNIKSIISFYRPEYPDIYCELMEHAESMSLIMTPPVFERMKQSCNSKMIRLIRAPHIHVYIFPENRRPPGLDTSDRFTYISFLDKNGRYDHKDIMSFDESALKWGDELFDYYCSFCEKIEI